jgi:hypothetical protein
MSSIHHRLPKDLLVMLVETIQDDVESKHKDAITQFNLVKQLLKWDMCINSCYLCKRWSMTLNDRCVSSENTQWRGFRYLSELQERLGDAYITSCMKCDKNICRRCSTWVYRYNNLMLCNPCVAIFSAEETAKKEEYDKNFPPLK